MGCLWEALGAVNSRKNNVGFRKQSYCETMKLGELPAREIEVPCKLKKPHVLVIYCDKREKEDVKNFLETNFKNREFCWYYKLDLQTLYQVLERGNEKELKNFYNYWDLRAEEGKRTILESMKRLNFEP